MSMRKNNANISMHKNNVEMGVAALNSLWPALSLRCALITNKNLELHELRNLSSLLADLFWPEEKPVKLHLT